MSVDGDMAYGKSKGRACVVGGRYGLIAGREAVGKQPGKGGITMRQ
jgi:hypothetical protein